MGDLIHIHDYQGLYGNPLAENVMLWLKFFFQHVKQLNF
jgi:hypothetical protein